MPLNQSALPFDTITYEKRGPTIGHITLSRAQAQNALSYPLASELETACRAINDDPEILAVILTGQGEFFSIGNGEGPTEDDSEEGLTPGDLCARALSNIRVPIVCAVNGPAMGAGLALALHCDLRIASEKALFAFPETSQGSIPSAGATQLLPRIVGRGPALEMILTGNTIDAQEAWRKGLVYKVVPYHELAATAQSIAEKIAQKAPIATRYAKEAVIKGSEMSLLQGMGLEGDLYFLLHTTEDRTEGIRAFLEKRTPRFKGS